jgi:hypothetical protein
MMLQNITLSAEKVVIERARQRTKALKTTLNAEFHHWLAQYAEYPQTAADLAVIMDQFGYAQTTKTFTRDELNER